MKLGKLVGTIATLGAVATFAPASASAGISLQFNAAGTDAPSGGAVNSFSWGVSSPSSGPGGGVTGRAKYQQVTLTKPVDSSSPKYPFYLGTNRPLRKAQIFFDQPNSIDGLALCMDDVRITKYELNDEANPSGGGPDNLTESLTLNYAKISYVIYLDAGPLTATFDFRREDARVGLTTGNNPCATNT